MKKLSKKIFLITIVAALIAATLAFTASATTRLWPVPGYKTTSRRYSSSHYGLDIAGNSINGATVVSAMGGYVTKKYTCNANHYPNSPSCCYGFGNGLVIKGDDGLYYQYAHMQAGSIPSNVYVGAYVPIGAQIGKVGNTGNSTGPHLHFQMSTATPMNSYSVNPDNYTFVDSLSWKTSASKVNLGESFYARIVNTAADKPLTVQSDGNVVIDSLTDITDQIWEFTRNSDGSYAIISLYNKNSLDVYGAYSTSNTNLQTHPYHGGTAQQWSIYGSEGSYIISAACTDCVIDVTGASSEDGTNVALYTKNDSIAQLFSIEKVTAPEKPVLTTSENGKKTVFKWKKEADISYYSLDIMKDGSVYKSIPTVSYIDFPLLNNATYTISLPNGIYTAVLTATNIAGSTKSDTIQLIVNNNPDSSGWMYATSLPSGVTSENYVIEYCSTYTTIAKTSPGSEWVKGSVAKQEYENSGSVYYSGFPLEETATRELVDTSYYHWCSSTTSNNANFAQTSSFTHYDGISKDNVYEYSAHADFDDKRFTYYVLKYKDTDAYVYCQSGVTCDGAYGSHGNRSYYWYKSYAYQDKVAIDYYYFTKQGTWSDTQDSTASSYIVRYKAIEHSYVTKLTKATLTKNGNIKTVCTDCGKVKSTKTVSYPKTITLSATSLTYNGKVRTPSVTVKDAKGNVLKKGTDYTVTYASGRKNVGTYKVTVKMIGNYTGTKTLSFSIKPVDISKCTLKLSATNLTYNGKVRTPVVTVTNANGVKLTKGTDYTVTYASGRKNVGTYKVTVTMKGNYTGTKTLTFKIKPIDISTCKVKLSATSLTYNGKVRTPVVTVTNANGVKLTKDTHYTVTYSSGRKNAGTYKVTVTMKGNYTGTKTLTFKIKPIDISTCKVKLSATSLTYNGEIRTPEVSVTNSYGTTLKEKNYTVTYSSGRKNVGTYKITVKMKGNYTGTKTLTFKILPPKTTISKLTAGAKKITVNLTKKTTQTTGYQIQYSTSKSFTNAKTVTIANSNTVKATLTGLTANKTYYVRVRTFKTVNDVKYYSGWSAYKYVKTK